MALTGMAAGNIVADPSFSWWGAWLGETPGRAPAKPIVAPQPWFKGRLDDPEAPYPFGGYHDTRDLIPPRRRRI